MQAAGHRGTVVDSLGVNIVLPEEHRLVTGHRLRKFSVGERAGSDASFVQPSEIMPMPRQALATVPLLAAVDMDGSSLLPKGALGNHDLRTSLGKGQFG